MEDLFYILLSIVLMVLIVGVPVWGLGRVIGLRGRENQVVEESGHGSAEVTGRAGVAMTAVNITNQQ